MNSFRTMLLSRCQPGCLASRTARAAPARSPRWAVRSRSPLHVPWPSSSHQGANVPSDRPKRRKPAAANLASMTTTGTSQMRSSGARTGCTRSSHRAAAPAMDRSRGAHNNHARDWPSHPRDAAYRSAAARSIVVESDEALCFGMRHGKAFNGGTRSRSLWCRLSDAEAAT